MTKANDGIILIRKESEPMNDGLYHKNIFLPNLHLKTQALNLQASTHAKESANNDRYGTFTLPSMINFDPNEILEIEIENNELIKILIRTKYDKKFDISLAISTKTLTIKTAWLNLASDKHSTLNPNLYQKRN